MLGINIRMLRKKQEMSQVQFAEKLGVTQGTVSQWETGVSQPETDLLIRMAVEFDVSLDMLLGISPKENGSRPEKGLSLHKLDPLSQSIIRDVIKLPPEKKQCLRAYLDGLKEK